MRHLARDAKILARRGTPIGWGIAAVIAVVLVLAWIDGGEEPLRIFDQPIDVPEAAR